MTGALAKADLYFAPTIRRFAQKLGLLELPP